MKLSPFLAICVLLLSACASAATPVSNVAATSEVTVTFTPIPMITPTPTETPDPNMPIGATGKNSDGLYIKVVTENGKPVTYEWNAELNGWFTSHILESPDNLDGGIPIFDPGDGYSAGSPFFFYVQEDVLNVPFLRHTANLQDWGKSLSGAVYNNLFSGRFKSSLTRLEMADTLYSGALIVPFTTPDGKEHFWKLGPRIGYEFYAIPWNDADPAIHPEFFETPTVKQFGGEAVYRWTVYTKEDGTLVAKAAVQDLASLTDLELMEWILNPMGTVIEFENLPTQEQLGRGWWFSSYPGDFVSGATTRPSRPYFDIVKKP